MTRSPAKIHSYYECKIYASEEKIRNEQFWNVLKPSWFSIFNACDYRPEIYTA